MADNSDVDISIKLTADTKAGKEAEKAVKAVGKASKEAEATGKTAAGGLKSAYEGFGKTVNTVGKAVRNFTKALGLIGFAVSAIQTVIAAYQKLEEWLHRNETAAAKLREEMEKKAYAESVREATEAYAKLNAEIAKANEAEREKDAIVAARENKQRSVEDAKLKLQENQELAAVSDDDPDAEAKRTLIRNKYAAMRAKNDAKRASEDNDRQRNSLYQSAGQDEDAARAIREQMQGTLGQNVDEARKKYNAAKHQSENATKKSFWTGRQVADEDARAKAKEQLPELEKQLEEAIKAYNEAKAKADQLEENAKKKVKAASELVGADQAAQINAAAEQVAIDTSNRQTKKGMDKAQQERARQKAEQKRIEQEKQDAAAAEQAKVADAQKAAVLLQAEKERIKQQIAAAQANKDAANLAVFNAQGNYDLAVANGSNQSSAMANLQAAQNTAQNVSHETDRAINALTEILRNVEARLKAAQSAIQNSSKQQAYAWSESPSGT